MKISTPKKLAPPDFLPACRKLGPCVQGGFIRVIKAAISTKENPPRFGDDAEATKLFNQALNSGVIVARQLDGIGEQITVYEVK